MNKRSYIIKEVGKVLKTTCRPIHYRSEVFKPYVDIIESKKTQGPVEHFRQMFGSESATATAISDGYIYLTDWKNVDTFRLFNDPPEPLLYTYSEKAIEDAKEEIKNRSKYMNDIPASAKARDFGILAEKAVLEFFKKTLGDSVKGEKNYSYEKPCDYDIKINYGESRSVLIDVKSSTVLNGPWNPGRMSWNNGHRLKRWKNDIYYVFVQPSNQKENSIEIVGFNNGSNLPVGQYAPINNFLHIHHFIGWLAYRDNSTWIK